MYRTIGSLLTGSTSPIPPGGRVRAFFTKGFIYHCGKNININKGAVLSRQLSIGDNSGTGQDSRLQGNVVIGDNVMIGPECRIYTTNHEFSDLDNIRIK